MHRKLGSTAIDSEKALYKAVEVKCAKAIKLQRLMECTYDAAKIPRNAGGGLYMCARLRQDVCLPSTLACAAAIRAMGIRKGLQEM